MSQTGRKLVQKKLATKSLFWQPRYWLGWFSIGILWSLAKLPYRVAMAVGVVLGYLGMWILSSRRRIVRVNLKLCFPDYSVQQRAKLLRATFRAFGQGVVEAAIAWWGSNAYVHKLTYRITGLSILQDAIAAGDNIILIAPHLYTLEIGGRILGQAIPIGIIYQAASSQFFDHLIRTKRFRFFNKLIERDNLKSFIKAVNNKERIIYLPDQDFGEHNSVFAPFFNVPTATATATARIVKMTKAKLIFIYCLRHQDKQQYEVVIEEPLQNFPSGDDLKDASTINQNIEEIVKLQPENYMWVHRRFKTRPAGESDVY